MHKTLSHYGFHHLFDTPIACHLLSSREGVEAPLGPGVHGTSTSVVLVLVTGITLLVSTVGVFTSGRVSVDVHVVVDIDTFDAGSAYAAPSHDMLEFARTYAVSQAAAKINTSCVKQVNILRNATRKGS